MRKHRARLARLLGLDEAVRDTHTKLGATIQQALLDEIDTLRWALHLADAEIEAEAYEQSPEAEAELRAALDDDVPTRTLRPDDDR